MNINDKILNESRKASLLNRKNPWKGSEFEFLLPLSSDERGRWGEDHFHRILQEYTDYSVVWDGDSNIEPEDGTYDMKANSLRTEMKTAMKGTKTDSWQHDVIKEVDVYDKLVLFDLVYSGFYITIIKNTEMVYGTRHPIFEKKSTACKGGWKFDMSNATLRKGIAAGLTYFHDFENPKDIEFSKFLVRHFS
tara:strand:- start:743 stop:1318 length:576 start_codon:yes stop_codon:yes gene_type:complete